MPSRPRRARRRSADASWPPTAASRCAAHRFASRRPRFREGRGTTTDANGRYEFRRSPCRALHGVGVEERLRDDQLRSTASERTGQAARARRQRRWRRRWTSSLPRGGIITGRVAGRVRRAGRQRHGAADDTRVINGERRPMPMGMPSTTPDTGEFRLWGLAPGRVLRRRQRSRDDDEYGRPVGRPSRATCPPTIPGLRTSPRRSR